MRSNVINLACILILLCATSWARCKDATSDQIPHGANELIVLEEQTVARLDGTTLYQNGDLAGEIVVEIYSYQGSAETTESIKDTVRIAACVTGSDGTFEFDLPRGRYLLRAGTVQSAGIQEVRAIFRVTGRGKPRKVEIRLPVGT